MLLEKLLVMKKLSIMVMAFFTLIGCNDELEFNSPAVQGFKNGVVYRADFYRADIDRGGLVVEGRYQSEIVYLITTRDNRGTYELGGDNQSEAIFIDARGVRFSTLNTPDPTVQVYPTDGEIIIDRFHQREGDFNRASGTFWFNAFSEDGLESVNFNRGHFYRVPISGGIPLVGGGTSCDDAWQNHQDTRDVFNATDESMPDYTDVCNAFKAALFVQLNACEGDEVALQALIDSLGDCIP